jgi:hypothetical protein
MATDQANKQNNASVMGHEQAKQAQIALVDNGFSPPPFPYNIVLTIIHYSLVPRLFSLLAEGRVW